MDKEGIGTDATISEHIATIQNRDYAKKTPANRFTPTNIGLALVETYMYLQYPLYKPYLRAHMERECTAISEGRVHFQEVVDSCIGEMSLVYQDVNAKKDVFRDTFIQFLNKRIPELALPVASVAAVVTEHLIPCVQCGGDLSLMAQHKGEAVVRFLQCAACGNSLSLPPKGEIVPQSARCPICSYSLLQIRSGPAPSDGYCVCPFCYSNPSAANAIDIESLPLGFTLPCFRCNHDCPFASTSRPALLSRAPRDAALPLLRMPQRAIGSANAAIGRSVQRALLQLDVSVRDPLQRVAHRIGPAGSRALSSLLRSVFGLSSMQICSACRSRCCALPFDPRR